MAYHLAILHWKTWPIFLVKASSIAVESGWEISGHVPCVPALEDHLHAHPADVLETYARIRLWRDSQRRPLFHASAAHQVMFFLVLVIDACV